MIRLAVNADDFGFTRDVNDGIVEAHRHGVLTSTTLMATAPAFDHAVELARANPTLDVGCHLTLIGGDSLTTGPLPPNVRALIEALIFGRIPIYEELAAQVRKIKAAGIVPTHLDTHKHTHLAPPVLRAVARISREFGIPWIRRPLVPYPVGRLLAGCRMADHFVGYRLNSRVGPFKMEQAIRSLSPGFTEFMCHPGFCRAELRAAPTVLKQSRERELEAIVSPAVRRAIEDRGIILTPFG